MWENLTFFHILKIQSLNFWFNERHNPRNPCSITRPTLTRSSFVISAPSHFDLFNLYIMTWVSSQTQPLLSFGFGPAYSHLTLNIPRDRHRPWSDRVKGITLNKRMNVWLTNTLCESFHQASEMITNESMRMRVWSSLICVWSSCARADTLSCIIKNTERDTQKTLMHLCFTLIREF